MGTSYTARPFSYAKKRGKGRDENIAKRIHKHCARNVSFFHNQGANQQNRNKKHRRQKGSAKTLIAPCNEKTRNRTPEQKRDKRAERQHLSRAFCHRYNERDEQGSDKKKNKGRENSKNQGARATFISIEKLLFFHKKTSE